MLNIIVTIKSLSAVQSPPRIVKQPPTDELLFQVAQQQNENDKPFIIECEAEGEPAPKYVSVPKMDEVCEHFMLLCNRECNLCRSCRTVRTMKYRVGYTCYQAR
jgi:hypothetical protein